MGLAQSIKYTNYCDFLDREQSMSETDDKSNVNSLKIKAFNNEPVLKKVRFNEERNTVKRIPNIHDSGDSLQYESTMHMVCSYIGCRCEIGSNTEIYVYDGCCFCTVRCRAKTMSRNGVYV